MTTHHDRVRGVACTAFGVALLLALTLLTTATSAASAATTATTTTHEYTLVVGWSVVNADGFSRAAVAINGTLPGPTLHSRKGDRMRITVINELDAQTLSMHWHGILQTGTPWADGVERVNQCAITPGSWRVYEFVTDVAGTYWYHSHTAAQRIDGVYGALLVADVDGAPSNPLPSTAVQDDVTLVLDDYYHEPAPSLSLLADMKAMRTFPQRIASGLVSGRGWYNCSNVPRYPNPPPGGVPFKCTTIDDKLAHLTSVTIRPSPATTTTTSTASTSTVPTDARPLRVRLINTSANSLFNFSIAGHTFVVVEADGLYTQPTAPMRSLRVDGGQRYSLLVTPHAAHTDAAQRAYWMYAQRVSPFAPWTVAPAQLRYAGAPSGRAPEPLAAIDGSSVATLPPPPYTKLAYPLPMLYPNMLHPLHATATPPPATRVMNLEIVDLQPSTGRWQWQLNGDVFEFPSYPVLDTMYYRAAHPQQQQPLPFGRSNRTNALVVEIEYGEVFELRINNTSVETHPWHTHGTSPWVMWSSYNSPEFELSSSSSSSSSSSYPYYPNPIQRDTAIIPASGQLAVRFAATNPGAWIAHCHVAWHVDAGFAMVLAVGEKQLPPKPRSVPTCENSAWFDQLRGDDDNDDETPKSSLSEARRRRHRRRHRQLSSHTPQL